MPKFPIAGRLAALASVILLSLAGCGGGSTPSPDTPSTPPPAALGTVRGVVADAASGAPLAGVDVKIGALSARSDANGAYAISGVPTAGAVVAQFSKTQYASNFATVAVNQDRTSVANRSLAKVAIVQNIDAALGATVSLSGSPAQVQLPAAGLVDASGAPYAGAATVAMTPIDARLHPLTMPGNYRAEGEPAPIESLGALQVEIRAADGALLNLAPGKRATIRIPVPAGSASPPLTMPLYYFKETSGLWVREGMATLAGNPPQQYYEGTVAHFSTWNADQPQDTLTINGCVVDGQQKPLAATVTSSGIDYNGSASVQTLADGTFKVPARRNSQVLVSAEDGSFSASVTVTTGITDLTLPACLVIEPQLPVILRQPRSMTIAPGTFATLDVIASNAVQYTWFHNGTLIASGAPVLPLVGGAGTEGSYDVEVSNRLGKTVSTTVTITVGAAAAPPRISAQPQDAGVVVGASPSFALQADGDGLRYQWLRNGVEIASARGPTLTLAPAVAGDDGALFSCRVSNDGGTVLSNAARLSVTSELIAPAFVQHPASIAIRVGERASFGVSVSGSTPLSYQWLRNGSPIAGATGATYQSAAATLADSGAQLSVRATNAKGSATSNAATLSVSASPDIAGLYLSFIQGGMVNGEPGYGIIPAAGGTASTFLAAGQGKIAETLIQGQISGGQLSNAHLRSLMYWKGGQLLRRELIGSPGLPAAVRVSTITDSGICNRDSDASNTFVTAGDDINDINHSWKILQHQGSDTVCNSDDDRFFAVRADMAPDAAPLAIARPVATLHAANGSLSGWVVRNGQQLQRVDANFQNPVTFFTLTDAELSFDTSADADSKNYWVFGAGNQVHVVDLGGTIPTPRWTVATLADQEFLANVTNGNQNDIVIVLGSSTASRVLRFSEASKTANAVGNAGATARVVAVTPTRVVLAETQGALVSMALGGGAASTIYTPGAPRFSFLHYRGGERVWQDMPDAVITVNSDGSGAQTLTGARIAGCIHQPLTLVENADVACDAIMIVTDNVVRSYDARTGALRVTYGTITPAAAPLINNYFFSMWSAWGQTAVLSQMVSNPSVPSQVSVVNYFLKTDQAGITPIVMP